MANVRQEDKSTQGMEDAARRATERAAEQTSQFGQAAADQTSRAGQAAAETTEEMARASATLLKQNVETLQNAWRFGLEAATSVMGRSTEQFGRTLGFSGEGVEEATERSTRNSKALLHTGAATAKAMDGISMRVLSDGSASNREEHGPHESVVELSNSSGFCRRSNRHDAGDRGNRFGEQP